MDWKQKYIALMAIQPKASMKMTTDGRFLWTLENFHVEKGDGKFLRGTGTFAASPQQLVEETWKDLTTLNPKEFLVINAMSENRKEFFWNGFMWQDR